MRALLTMLGVIIGIASVIGILTIGQGLTDTITGEFGDLGATNIIVYVEQKSEAQIYSNGMGYMQSVPEDSLLTDDMITALEEQYGERIESIALSEGAGSASFEDGTVATVTGVTPAQFTTITSSMTITGGRNFTQIDCDQATNTAILSQSLLDQLMESGYTKGVGDDVVVPLNNNLEVFDIVGVYDDSSNNTDSIYIPIDTAKKLGSQLDGYEQITVVAQKDEDVYEFSDEIEELLNRFYVNNDKYQVGVENMQSMLDSMNEMMATVSLALSAIAGISLLVGGIGVMNIMLVTVTERTKEIGTRKALGATGRQIQIQFVTEGAIICGIGGIIGIILGATLGYVGSTLMGVAVLPSMQNIMLATGISLGIGIFFSYSPAKKAAKLNPIDALRYE